MIAEERADAALTIQRVKSEEEERGRALDSELGHERDVEKKHLQERLKKKHSSSHAVSKEKGIDGLLEKTSDPKELPRFKAPLPQRRRSSLGPKRLSEKKGEEKEKGVL